MKRYVYRTDGESGEIEATDLRDALRAACDEAQVTEAAIDDGAWCWVEDPDTGERETVGIVP